MAGCAASHAARRHAVTSSDAQQEAGLHFQTSGWSTDFSRHTVPLSTIASGGPRRDGIPPLDRPRFVSIAAAARFLTEPEPVIALSIGGRARAYPLQILLWHEIVNDTVAGTPVAVTYCPLCNTAIVYARRVGARLLSFGTTGDLRNSDLVMWDRQTQSWWQQYDGSAIVGALAGVRLTALPSATVSFAEFRSRYPHGIVLSRDTGFARPYGHNPYVGYDEPNGRPFLYAGRLDPRLAPLEHVEAITNGPETAVLPFAALRVNPVAMLKIGAVPAVVLFDRSVSSPLEAAATRDSRAVGATAPDSRPAGVLVCSRRVRAARATGRAVTGVQPGASQAPRAARDASRSASTRTDRSECATARSQRSATRSPHQRPSAHRSVPSSPRYSSSVPSSTPRSSNVSSTCGTGPRSSRKSIRVGGVKRTLSTVVATPSRPIGV
jgi:hypothetical protein